MAKILGTDPTILSRNETEGGIISFPESKDVIKQTNLRLWNLK